ncbi:MAG: hypothetical protein IIA07_02630 [Proteobacteria bacterium]|nr:hypothetical protein [Pseudomonadota bacterium]
MQLKQKIIRILLHVVGVAMLVNGIWMVSQALEWFFNIPADMMATGEPNGHLIRDVGIAYIVFGSALNWCALELQNRRYVFLMVAFFMVAHAIGHAVEILIGLLPDSHWWIDFPLVLLPGLIFGVLAIPRVWVSMIGDGMRH